MSESQLAITLRERAEEIAAAWHRDLASPSPMFGGAVVGALASWLDGDREHASARLRELAHARVVEHHRAGRGLDVVLGDYAGLRRAILEVVFGGPTPGFGAAAIALSAAVDHAVAEACERFEAEREHVHERFIGMLVHDLRDPLTAVVMSTNLLAEMSLGERQTQLLGRIARGARRIDRMVGELADFARSRLGEPTTWSPTTVDMSAVCEEAIRDVHVLWAQREVSLETRGDVVGRWDHERVRVAVANVIANALQTSQGAVEVRVVEVAPRNAVVVSVCSCGATIPPEYVERLFDPFARAVLEHSRIRGLGLGLSMAAHIAGLHGGAAQATSDADGITISIEWPRDHRS